MTSSEDSADDFESADEDFDTTTKSGSSNTVLKKEENEYKQNSDNVVQHSTIVDTVENSIKSLQVSSQNTSKPYSDNELLDLKTEISKHENTKSITDYRSTEDNSVNDNSFLKQNDEENNSLPNPINKNSSNILSKTDDYENPDKEANTRTEDITLQSLKMSGSVLQECSTNSYVNKAANSQVIDLQNEPLVRKVPIAATLSAESTFADDSELGDGWDFEEENLEADSAVETSKAELIKNADAFKQDVDNTNSKSNKGWGDFDVDNDEGYTDNPGDGWEIEEDYGSEIPMTSSIRPDKSIQSAQDHISGSKHTKSSHSDEQVCQIYFFLFCLYTFKF